MVKLTDIYWLAGLLEGEGHFAYYDSPRIQLVMTDEDIVSRARNLLNKETKILICQPRTSNRKISYRFTIGGNIAMSWMMTLYSLMGRRRKEQIREVIKKWKIQKRSPDAEYCQKGHPLLLEGIDYNLAKDNYKSCVICAKEYYINNKEEILANKKEYRSPKERLIRDMMKFGLSREQAVIKLETIN